MMTVQGNFSAVTSPLTTINDRWPAVILSAVYNILIIYAVYLYYLYNIYVIYLYNILYNVFYSDEASLKNMKYF